MTRTNSNQYPVDWPAIAREIKEAVDYVCQECGQQCRRPGEFNLGWQFTLTVAHWDREYEDEVVFCVALCVRCHFRHDSKYSWIARRRYAYIRQRIAGQLGLLLDARMIG